MASLADEKLINSPNALTAEQKAIKLGSWEQKMVNAIIERCAQKLEKAYAECDTLNLLHGAARLRAMKGNEK